MNAPSGTDKPLRVLVADDESAIREAYAQVFGEADLRQDLDAIQDLRARLFKNNAPAQAAAARRTTFEATLCSSAAEAVAAVSPGHQGRHALPGRVPRHAHAPGRGRRLGRGPHPRARPGH